MSFKGKFIIFFTILFLPHILAAQDRETQVVRAVRKVGPAVVNISAAYTETYRVPGFSDPFFDEFFRDFFEDGPRQNSRQRKSLGSGVIIDGKKGYVLTNAHVVARGETITVTLEDGRELKALRVGSDVESDLAVLRLEGGESLPQASMGTSQDLMIGETVIAIGNPFGFSHTVTTGVVSAVNRHVKSGQYLYKHFIQTDASINPGNSGGPLLNILGEVIGINTAIYTQARGIGFAIPIDRARKVANDLIQYGTLVPAWVGLHVQSMDQGLASYLGNDEQGLYVRDVEDNSPASRAGIQKGDILLAVSGVPLAQVSDYREQLDMLLPEHPVHLKVLRKDRALGFSLKVRPYPMERAGKLLETRLGILASDPLPGTRGAVLTKIRKNSVMERIGARPGDRISGFGERSVNNLKDLQAAMIRYRMESEVRIRIQRGNGTYTLTVPME